MNGKEKCNLLRQIRKEIAEANDIVYLSAECTYEGDCRGTCPKCDAEIKYLENELNEKAANGEKISLSGITMNTYLNSLADDFNDIDDLDTTIFIPDVDSDEIVEGEIDEPVMGGLEVDLEPFYSNKQNLTIEDLEFGCHAYRCLKNAGIKTVKELTDMSDEELIRIQNMSRGILSEIKMKVHELGLLFKDDYE